MFLYFAGPLFNANETAFNARLTAAIETLGYEVFLPQRDGYGFDSHPEIAGTDEEAGAIFELDCKRVLACDVLLCVLDGRVPDEGVAVELGLAYADRVHNKPGRELIGYLTQRSTLGHTQLNAMLRGALDELFHDEDSLLEHLGALIKAGSGS